MLCVEENLSSGRRVVFGYRWDGAPTHCWDAAFLPPKWLVDPAWHRARLAFGYIPPGQADNGGLPTLFPAPEDLLAIWLARTYAYLEPILGRLGCVFSSRNLFQEQLVSHLSSLSLNACILEVGGSIVVQALCESSYRYGIAVDPSFSRMDPLPKDVHYVTGTIERLPLSDSSVDAVISSFVLEHLVNPEIAVQEVLRVLKDGGVFLFTIPVTDSEVGVPPLFHRWRFTSNEINGGQQSLPIRTLIPNNWKLFMQTPPKLSIVARESDAYLFEMVKCPHA